MPVTTGVFKDAAQLVTGTNFVVTNSLFAAQKYYRLSRIPAPFTPAPPMLTIQRASPVNVRLQWSTDDERPFSLQANTNLATSLWVSVTPAPTVAGTSYVVTNTISGTQKFYRLASP